MSLHPECSSWVISSTQYLIPWTFIFTYFGTHDSNNFFITRFGLPRPCTRGAYLWGHPHHRSPRILNRGLRINLTLYHISPFGYNIMFIWLIWFYRCIPVIFILSFIRLMGFIVFPLGLIITLSAFLPINISWPILRVISLCDVISAIVNIRGRQFGIPRLLYIDFTRYPFLMLLGSEVFIIWKSRRIQS